MATEVSHSEGRVVLKNVSWQTYEQLLANYQDSSSPRFTYDRGVLEIMILSARHEQPNRIIAALVENLADVRGIDFINLGSTTFKREDLSRGFEADSCFYFQNAKRIRGQCEIDLASDPPPELLIKIDITSPSLDKFPLYAQVGVTEVWRYDGEKLTIYRLQDEAYVESEESTVLPHVTSSALSYFVEKSKSEERPAWIRSVRKWARSLQ